MDKAEIITDIEAHIASRGGSYANWYVGIATDPKDRLFNDHNVSEHGGQWIHAPADSAATARAVESHFVNQRGTAGGTGGGDEDSRHVYAYPITSETREDR
ncbi:hypothetical protein ACFL26_01000 [Patescibacteria group bacterium]